MEILIKNLKFAKTISVRNQNLVLKKYFAPRFKSKF